MSLFDNNLIKYSIGSKFDVRIPDICVGCEGNSSSVCYQNMFKNEPGSVVYDNVFIAEKIKNVIENTEIPNIDGLGSNDLEEIPIIKCVKTYVQTSVLDLFNYNFYPIIYIADRWTYKYGAQSVVFTIYIDLFDAKKILNILESGLDQDSFIKYHIYIDFSLEDLLKK